MLDREKTEQLAANRLQWIAPLLATGLDPAQAQQLKGALCAQTGLSERTIRRYLAAYRRDGFEGLKPRRRGHRSPNGAIPSELLEQAIVLRREVPTRSIAQIIRILEWEGRALPGQVKRSTLQDQLAARGYSRRQMRLYTQSGVAARRFQRRHRNALWQSDIKFGPYLPIGPHGAKRQVYLVVFLDDATRFVMQGAFYPSLDQTIVEQSFRHAIQQYGVPEAVYFDNGSQYRTHQMHRICGKLGIRLVFTKPYAPESKGKVEKYNQFVDTFLAEIAVAKPDTLARLNALFQVWLTECYQTRIHTGLEPARSPEEAYRSDPQPLRWMDPDVLTSAFWHAETRKVDKAGCISFQGRKYEVGLAWIGRNVEIVYDPADPTILTCEMPGVPAWTARPLIIGERAGHRPPLPETLQPVPTDHSRLLAAAEARHHDRVARQAPAVSYRAVWKPEPPAGPVGEEGPRHV